MTDLEPSIDYQFSTSQIFLPFSSFLSPPLSPLSFLNNPISPPYSPPSIFSSHSFLVNFSMEYGIYGIFDMVYKYHILVILV
jgi:hypothetical protein